MINLIIAGIGGQGINSLAKVLAETCYQSGYECQFTVHKGGAQSLGSVYAEFRIHQGALPILGQGIPTGELDILIALDPWEGLRHVPLSRSLLANGSKTRLWIETQSMPFFIERDGESETDSQVSVKAQLESSGLDVNWRNYRGDATQQAGTAKMANYLAGLDCIQALKLSDKSLYDRLFFELVKKAKPFKTE